MTNDHRNENLYGPADNLRNYVDLTAKMTIDVASHVADVEQLIADETRGRLAAFARSQSQIILDLLELYRIATLSSSFWWAFAQSAQGRDPQIGDDDDLLLRALTEQAAMWKQI